MNVLTDAGVDPSRILLRNGDMLTVRAREESKVTVMGEVTTQGGVLMRNGRLTLNEALTESRPASTLARPPRARST